MKPTDEVLAQAGRKGSEAWETTMGNLMQSGRVPLDVAMRCADKAQAVAVLEALGSHAETQRRYEPARTTFPLRRGTRVTQMRWVTAWHDADFRDE